MKLQEQGKTEQARKDLGENSLRLLILFLLVLIKYQLKFNLRTKAVSP
jgi:hypothetical protein